MPSEGAPSAPVSIGSGEGTVSHGELAQHVSALILEVAALRAYVAAQHDHINKYQASIQSASTKAIRLLLRKDSNGVSPASQLPSGVLGLLTTIAKLPTAPSPKDFQPSATNPPAAVAAAESAAASSGEEPTPTPAADQQAQPSGPGAPPTPVGEQETPAPAPASGGGDGASIPSSAPAPAPAAAPAAAPEPAPAPVPAAALTPEDEALGGLSIEAVLQDYQSASPSVGGVKRERPGAGEAQASPKRARAPQATPAAFLG